jgi:hypothetical protein
MPQEFNPEITQYEYIGDNSALGSLQLTMLARSFEELEVGQLDDYFPSTMINERTIVIEQVIEGLGIAPIVRFGVPGGGFVEDDRRRSMRVTPAVTREEDFIEQALVNQLREPGTMNSAWSPIDIMQRRVQKLINRHRRLIDLFRAKVLLGGISYADPRTGVSINVSTNIPPQNLFSYRGYNQTVAANTVIQAAGLTLTANVGLANDKGRTEALFFTSTDNRCGVPWTDPLANIIRTIHYLRRYLDQTNKNTFTEMVMHPDLLTVIQESEQLKAYTGLPGVLVNNPNGVGVGTAFAGVPSHYVTMGPGGDITSLGGLRIRLLNGIYRDPVTNTIQTYWPAHQVALVAPRAAADPNAKLGMTQHCVGESPDGSPGLYMRTSRDAEPPSPPGRVMQIGDAFLPFAIYPHWISVVNVCEPSDLVSRIFLQADLAYGTF